jgi:hypothetical protein
MGVSKTVDQIDQAGHFIDFDMIVILANARIQGARHDVLRKDPRAPGTERRGNDEPRRPARWILAFARMTQARVDRPVRGNRQRRGRPRWK